MPSEDHLLPPGLFWIGFDDRNISKSTSIRKDGSDFCAEGGLTVKLCRQPADGWLLNRPISDFTMEPSDADA